MLDERYVLGEVIGVGGMGEVRVCRDEHLSREVAMKLVRSDRDTPRLEEKFLAEARVQGALEHPGIVPVYDLGRDGEGRAFFTMKRVRGIGLDVILSRLGRGDAKTEREYSLHRLLTAFSQVCLTVDFAHTRGVLHRDLKPANVMFGDYGEVYVLDWGIARVRRSATGGDGASPGLPRRGQDLDDTGPSSAPASGGKVVGTLGYIAPELAAGARGDACADVFSLGAILFEILAHEPIVADDVAAYRFLREPGAVERRPRLRAPDLAVPAELDAICYRATSPDPAVRFPTARALHDALEAFLSGDRDLLLRRRLAGEHIARASEMVTRALAGPIASDEMATALREAGRAVALCPDDPQALGILARLLTELPATTPPEVEEQLATLSQARTEGTLSGWVLLLVPAMWVVIYPLVCLAGGVRDIRQAVLTPVAWVAAGIAMYADLKLSKHKMGSWVTVAAAMMAAASTTVLTGPLMIVPAMTVGMAMGLSVRPVYRRLPLVLGCVVLIGTVALAWTGVHDAYEFAGETITFRLAQPMSQASLYTGTTALHLIVLLVGTRFLRNYRKALELAETKTILFSWRLSKLLPSELPPSSKGGR